VADRLGEIGPRVRPAFEGVAGRDEEPIEPRAIGDAAPAPHPAAAALVQRHRGPRRDALRLHVDRDHLALERTEVAVGAGGRVDTAVGEG
jgi:hypothetical protein